MDEKKVREAIEDLREIAYKCECMLESLPGRARERSIYKNIIQSLYIAIEALEKQLPEKVRLKQQRFSQACKCPNCRKTMIFKDETSYFCGARHKFCPDCGQRLDWSEE